MQFAPTVQLPDCFTRLFQQAVWRFPENEKVIYLTFDDGPVPEVTPWVLDILKEENISASFFCVGENVQKNPAVFSRILEEGHSVGNHTYNHLQGLKTANKLFFENIHKAEKYIPSDLFRPPHGWMRPSQYKVLSKRFQIIMWDVISNDYNSNLTAEKIIRNVTDYVRPGSIITFHDSVKAWKNLEKTLPHCISLLKKEGYTFKAIPYKKHTYKKLPARVLKAEQVL